MGISKEILKMSQALRLIARAGCNTIRNASIVQTQIPVVHTVVHSRNVITMESIPFGIRKWMFNTSGYCQYGPYKDDLIVDNEITDEAIRRLPLELQDERNFRLIRAQQLEMMKTVPPKEQWVTYEEDLEHGRYLQDLIEEVEKELEEIEEWHFKSEKTEEK